MWVMFLIMGRIKSGNQEEDSIRTRKDVHGLFIFGNLLGKGYLQKWAITQPRLPTFFAY